MENRPNLSPTPESVLKYDDIPGSTPLEKIQNAYARLRASASAGPNPPISNSETPSSAGDIEPNPPLSMPTTTLPLSTRAHNDRADLPPPERHVNPVEIVVPPTMLASEEAKVQTIHPSAIFENNQAIEPWSIRLGPSEFAVPLPMDSRSKDEYEITLEEHSHSVNLLLSNFKSPEGATVSEAEQAQAVADVRALIEKLDNVAVHTDLNIAAHVNRSSFEPAKEASWAEYSSAKFLFLGQLIEMAGAQQLHIIVMVRNAKSVELVERYFQGKEFEPTQQRNEMRGYIELSFQKGALSIGILSAQHDGIVETSLPPAVILALDSSFNASSPSVEHLRATYARHGNLLPVVHLLISNSCEHIQRCLLDRNDEVSRLKLLLKTVKDLQPFLGDLPDNALGVQENADEIFIYLLSEDFNASWKIPLIDRIVDRVPSDSQIEEGADTQDLEPISTTAAYIGKRMFDATEIDTPESKRPRVQASQDLTQTTEPTTGPTQALDLTTFKVLEDRMLEMKDNHVAEVSFLHKTIADLSERIKAWEDLQHRYESRNKNFHKIKKERDGLAAEKQKFEQKISKQEEEIAKLKDERTQLKHEVESARSDLKAEGGQKEELERAREQARQLNEKNAKLERTAERESSQAEYVRTQYQDTSNRMQALANENRQLIAENAELTRKQAADAAKLREIRSQSNEEKLLAQEKKYQRMIYTRDTLLQKREEELRNLRNNRPLTRATSTQPRSPKSWGNGSRPTSPGVNNNNNGVGNRGSGLRFSSEMSL